tara:strand:- start:151 stop:705 length:555 start_codon:yes stop_codon:yes gene_type:complete
MAYKYKGVYLKVGKSWTDSDGFKHPYNWASSWSADDLKKWGVTIEKDVNVSFDNRFYWAKGIEKKLEDENVVDEKGKAVIDPLTGEQQIQRGLKYQWIERTKSTANGLLSASDWYVTRKSETDNAIPDNITKYRADVRTATKTIEDKINACNKLVDFMKLFETPVDKDKQVTGNAPIYDFPKEV